MKREEFSEEETQRRFDALMKGAMHKPTPLKDIPKSRVKAKSKKAASSRRSAS